MPSAKSAYHHGDLRNALIEAATALVRERGAERFSLRDAARSVGVSANATYRHFDSKSALLSAVAAAGFVKLSHRMTKKLAASRGSDAGAAVERFKAAGRAYAEFAVENPDLFRVMFGTSGICRLLSNPLAVPSPTLPEILGGALDDLVRAGIVPEARRSGAEIKVWTVLHGFVCLLLDGADVVSTPAQVAATLEELLDFTVAGLGAPRG
ncbi:TetR family transcriptional regulator [Sorangium cellulosum]|uniref:TetR family transcriptional regulator n=1 Tax=Sorangium cellulosum TaxID=56 RepID=A0A2L0EI84_SORCE|nr:TetR/AcrR family transcriptional regulator [Sorangium cellulosum]AUX39008.1 TetR family transcriptional regulator [Sorangium cellulosum]